MGLNHILENGVRVYIPSKINPENRIMINDGTLRTDGRTVESGASYIADTFKPKSNWRYLDDDETLKVLTTNSALPYNRNIGIFRLPDDMIKMLQSFPIHECKNRNEIIETFLFSRLRGFKELQDHFIDLITSLTAVGRPASKTRLYGVNFGHPNLETAATFSTTGELYGLHIDNSRDENNIYNRDEAQNRLTLNIGKESRYILYINKTVKEIHELLIKEGHISKETNIPDGKLNKLFLTIYPNYPVLRVRQDPYEGYIAPTDNIIHDGSTLGSTSPDITVVFTGYFALGMQETN